MRTILIKYESCRIHFGNKNCWSGIFKDDLSGYDYHTKETLKRNAEKDGYNWEVLRIHRDGTKSVIERSLAKNIYNKKLTCEPK